jgi:hypothetical protein
VNSSLFVIVSTVNSSLFVIAIRIKMNSQ